MSYDEDYGEPQRKKKSGDSTSTAKVLLIVFGSFFGLVMLTCCGVGTYAFFWFKKGIEQANLTAPADIQKLTAEMADITILPEFLPRHGSSIFGLMKMAQYQWCPAGNCPPVEVGPGTMMLLAMNIRDPNPQQRGPQGFTPFSEHEFSDAALKQNWKDFTKTEHEFDIRGRKCKFYIVQGEQTGFQDMDDMGDDEEPEAPAEQAEADADPAPAAEPAHANVPGKKLVQVAGSFPGKEGEVSLQLTLTPEDYNEEKILGMLRSIK